MNDWWNEFYRNFSPLSRWFAGKGGPIEKVEFEKMISCLTYSEWLLTRIRVWLVGRPRTTELRLAAGAGVGR